VSSYTSRGSHAERRPASRVARFWPVTFRHVGCRMNGVTNENGKAIRSRRPHGACRLPHPDRHPSVVRQASWCSMLGRTHRCVVCRVPRAREPQPPRRVGDSRVSTGIYVFFSAAVESSTEKNTHTIAPVAVCRACSCIALVGHGWTRCASIGLNVRENVHSGSVASADWRRHGATGPRGTPSRHESTGP